MTVPHVPSWNTVNVHGEYRESSGDPVQGEIWFTPSVRSIDVPDKIVLIASRLVAVLDSDGRFSIDIPATDDPDLFPTGWTYYVEEQFTGGEKYSIEVLLGYNPDGLDISEASPAQVVPDVITFATLVQLDSLRQEVDDFINGSTNPAIIAHEAEADPHPVYLTAAEGAAAFDALGAASAAVTTHAGATDPHPTYLTQSEGDSRYDTLGAVASHAAGSDPHPVYLTQSEGDSRYDAIGAVDSHIAASDPHPVYLTQTEGDGRYDALGSAATSSAGAVSDHESASDPHAQYLTQGDADAIYIPLSQKGAASGVAPLGSDGKVPGTYISNTGTVTSVDGDTGPAVTLATDAAANVGSKRTLGTGALQATAGNDSRLSDARTPTAHHTSHATGGSDAVTPASIGAIPASDRAVANGVAPLGSDGLVPSGFLPSGGGGGGSSGVTSVDGDVGPTVVLATDAAANVGSKRTLGTGALQAAAGNDSRLSDARTPTGSAGGSLAGSYPNPTIAAEAVGGTEIASAIKDPAAATAGLRTLGTGATQAAAGNDARLSDQRTPADATVTPAKFASSAIDPVAGTAGARTLGTGSQQAAAGNDSRLSDARTPTAHASTHADGGSDAVTAISIDAWKRLTAVSVKTAAYTASMWELVPVDASGGAFTVTLPAASVKGIIVIRQDIGTNTVTYQAAGTDTINVAGTTSVTSKIANQSIIFISDGAGRWRTHTGVSLSALDARYPLTTDSRLSDSRAPSGAAGGSLGGTYPNPSIAAGAVGGTEIASAIKDPAAGTAGLRTLGTGAAQAAAGNDSRLSDTRTPSAASITPSMFAAAAIDPAAGTAGARTLGTGAAQAAAGNDSRMSDSRTPTAHASSHANGGSDPITPASIKADPYLVPTAVKTAAYTAAINDLVRCNTSSGGFTVTLPTGAASGERVGVNLRQGTNTLTISRGGTDTINNGLTSVTLVVTDSVVIFTSNGSGVWEITSVGNTVSGLDTRYALLTDSRFTDSRAPTGTAGGDLSGTYPNPTIKTALNDPSAATPGLRTLGTGSTQAAAGNDSRLSDARTPTAHKTSHATGGSDALTASDIGATATSDIQNFTASGTWNKPSGAKWVDVICIGGGGGGGSGRKDATSTIRSGGAPGSGGSITRHRFNAADLGATEAITIGAGGTGASSPGGNPANGAAGSDGGASSFGSRLVAGGGKGGAGGTGAASAATAGSTIGGYLSATTGVSGTTSGASGTNTPNSNMAAGGGGAGGGRSSGNANISGMNGGGVDSMYGATGIGTGATSSGAAGGSGTDQANAVPGPGGGGGCGNSSAADGGAGGAGGKYGGGGGGGAGALGTNNSGAGGTGAAGHIQVITIF